MIPRDLALALLLPLPPLLGFWVFRLKGRVGLSYGYFLGGTLAVLAMPWPLITGKAQPMADLGGALLGFSLYLQAHREGRQGIRGPFPEFGRPMHRRASGHPHLFPVPLVRPVPLAVRMRFDRG